MQSDSNKSHISEDIQYTTDMWTLLMYLLESWALAHVQATQI